MNASPALVVWTGMVGVGNLCLGSAPCLTQDVVLDGTLQQYVAPTMTSVVFPLLAEVQCVPQQPAYFGWPRFMSDYSTSPWSAARQERGKAALRLIDEFSAMHENWDGYGARRISPEACRFARAFIQALLASPGGLTEPDISPTSAGTISLEWEADSAEAYFEIGNSKFSGYVRAEGQEPKYIEGPGNELDQRLVTLIRDALFPPVPLSNTISIIAVRDTTALRLAA